MKCDPELRRQLSEAGSEGLVEAVLYLRPETAEAKAVESGRVAELVWQVIERAGVKLERLKVLPNLGMVEVRGRGGQIEELMRQPEIAGAMAGRGWRAFGHVTER